MKWSGPAAAAGRNGAAAAAASNANQVVRRKRRNISLCLADFTSLRANGGHRRRVSARLVVDEVRDQTQRPPRIRRSGVARDEGVRLAVEFVERDRAAGFGIGGGEI